MLQVRRIGETATVESWHHFSKVLHSSAKVGRWRATVISSTKTVDDPGLAWMSRGDQVAMLGYDLLLSFVVHVWR